MQRLFFVRYRTTAEYAGRFMAGKYRGRSMNFGCVQRGVRDIWPSKERDDVVLHLQALADIFQLSFLRVLWFAHFAANGMGNRVYFALFPAEAHGERRRVND